MGQFVTSKTAMPRKSCRLDEEEFEFRITFSVPMLGLDQIVACFSRANFITAASYPGCIRGWERVILMHKIEGENEQKLI